jgi:hypothetical protein
LENSLGSPLLTPSTKTKHTHPKEKNQNKTANKSETEKILIIQLLKQNLSATSSQKKRDSEKPLCNLPMTAA